MPKSRNSRRLPIGALLGILATLCACLYVAQPNAFVPRLLRFGEIMASPSWAIESPERAGPPGRMRHTYDLGSEPGDAVGIVDLRIDRLLFVMAGAVAVITAISLWRFGVFGLLGEVVLFVAIAVVIHLQFQSLDAPLVWNELRGAILLSLVVANMACAIAAGFGEKRLIWLVCMGLGSAWMAGVAVSIRLAYPTAPLSGLSQMALKFGYICILSAGPPALLSAYLYSGRPRFKDEVHRVI